MKPWQTFEKAIAILKTGGWSALRQRTDFFVSEMRDASKYRKWVERNKPSRPEIEREIGRFARQPLISVIVPVYNIDEKWLRRCIGSVKAQIYGSWELCIADDRSPAQRVREVIRGLASDDPRIRFVFREENGHISAASNSALELASGEFCVLLDHDDELSEDALFYVAREINEHPETAFIYSDEDLIDENGRRSQPKFKPDFSRDLLYSLNLITHLSAYRTDVLRAVGGFRLGVEGSQDYDLALRVLETIDESRIRHIPRVLYHWRAIRGSVAFAPEEKPYAFERAREAIREHLDRCGKMATVRETLSNLNRVSYTLPEPPPKIRIIRFGTEDDADTLRHGTSYRDFEIVSVRGRSADALNRAASTADAELICFLDSGLEPLNPDWLGELAGFACQPEIGAVGGKLIDPRGAVAGGGLVFGGPQIVRFAHRALPRDAAGNMCRNRVISNFSAVSVACLMIRRELFETLGGFDASGFPEALFDADLCLRIRETGRRIVATPYAELRGNVIEIAPSPGEAAAFESKWSRIVARDPFYNPNLSATGRTFAFGLE